MTLTVYEPDEPGVAAAVTETAAAVAFLPLASGIQGVMGSRMLLSPLEVRILHPGYFEHTMLLVQSTADSGSAMANTVAVAGSDPIAECTWEVAAEEAGCPQNRIMDERYTPSAKRGKEAFVVCSQEVEVKLPTFQAPVARYASRPDIPEKVDLVAGKTSGMEVPSELTGDPEMERADIRPSGVAASQRDGSGVGLMWCAFR